MECDKIIYRLSFNEFSNHTQKCANIIYRLSYSNSQCANIIYLKLCKYYLSPKPFYPKPFNPKPQLNHIQTATTIFKSANLSQTTKSELVSSWVIKGGCTTLSEFCNTAVTQREGYFLYSFYIETINLYRIHIYPNNLYRIYIIYTTPKQYIPNHNIYTKPQKYISNTKIYILYTNNHKIYINPNIPIKYIPQPKIYIYTRQNLIVPYTNIIIAICTITHIDNMTINNYYTKQKVRQQHRNLYIPMYRYIYRSKLKGGTKK